MSIKASDRRWLPLNALRAFEGVAKHGSFTAAAKALLTSQSTISRHVIFLEHLIGVQLLERRPHALTLTRPGEHLLLAVAKSFDRLEYAIEDVRNAGTPRKRTLRVQMAPSFAAQLAVPILKEFRQASTDVDIDVVSPYGVGLPLGDVDVAVVYSKPAVTDLVVDLLWPERLRILCHPQIAARDREKPLAAFVEANELVHVRIADEPRHDEWSRLMLQAGLGALKVERGLVFDTAMFALQYISSGEGIALLDTRLFAEEIRAGRLACPFEETLETGYGYYLVTHPEMLADTAISLFRSWLIERVGTGAAPGTQRGPLHAHGHRHSGDERGLIHAGASHAGRMEPR